jgi:hypothetical protein
MTKAEEMAKFTKESAYEKYKDSIEKALRFIKSNAQQGLYYCTLKYTNFPEAKEAGFRNWFVNEGFNYTEYNTDSVTIIW